MANTIKVAAGFSVGNSEPIDDRTRVATIAERDAILSYRRAVGLECIVQNDGSGNVKKYRLEGGITNANWKDITEGGTIQTRDTNATANTIPLRDSNGNFQIKLAQDKIFIGNTFGFAEARTLPYNLTGQGGKIIAVKSDLTGYEYISPSTGSINNVNVKAGVTGLTATKTGDTVELDATYPSAIVQSATGFPILTTISSNKLAGATLVAGTNVTISESTGETISGIATKRLTISSNTATWSTLSGKPNWTGFMPTSPLTGLANKVLMVNPTEVGYEYSTVLGSVSIDPVTVGATATTSGMDVTLAFDYPSAIGATSGFNVIDQITQNTLFVKAIRAGSGITITETNSGSTAGSPPIPLKYLTIAATAPVVGTNTQVVFNDGGTLAGSSDFTYDKVKKILKVGSLFKFNTDNFSGTGVGFEALNSIGSNANNFTTAVGLRSMYSLTDSNNGNTAIGHRSGYAITTGAGNTLIGSFTGSDLINGNRNIIIGESAFKGNGISSSSDNICIGYNCGTYESSTLSGKLLVENIFSRNFVKDYLIEGDFTNRAIRINGAKRRKVNNITASNTNLISGTATSGTSTTLFDSSKTFNDTYVFKLLILTGGTGAGQVRVTSGYTSGGGIQVNANNPFTTIPDATTTYKIVELTRILGENMGGDYFVSLGSEDYGIWLPVCESIYDGCFTNIMLRANASGKTLYIVSNTNTQKIQPDNSVQKSLTTTYQNYKFYMHTSEWIVQ